MINKKQKNQCVEANFVSYSFSYSFCLHLSLSPLSFLVSISHFLLLSIFPSFSRPPFLSPSFLLFLFTFSFLFPSLSPFLFFLSSPSYFTSPSLRLSLSFFPSLSFFIYIPLPLFVSLSLFTYPSLSYISVFFLFFFSKTSCSVHGILNTLPEKHIYLPQVCSLSTSKFTSIDCYIEGLLV